MGSRSSTHFRIWHFFLSRCEVRDDGFIVSLKLPFYGYMELNLFNEMNR